MAIFYPRKQTVIIFIICAAIIAGLIAYESTQRPNNTADESSLSAVTSPDSGLIDPAAASTTKNSNWQKQFLADGPSASIKMNSSATDPLTKDAPLSRTDVISHDLFTQYMQAHQAGLDNDPTVISGMADRLGNQISAAAIPVRYATRDIIIIPDSSNAAIFAYAKRTMHMLDSLPSANEAQIANDALSSGDLSGLKDLDPIIASYQSIISSLKSEEVPQKLANDHLNLMNGISISLFNAQALRKVDTDPVQALGALDIYMQGLQQISDALQGLQNSFDAAKIVFVEPINTTNKP